MQLRAERREQFSWPETLPAWWCHVLAEIGRLPREHCEWLVERLIDQLDAWDGDPDCEDDGSLETDSD